MSDDIAAWLTAIWDEDEAAYRENPDDDYMPIDAQAALARIAADRQILELHMGAHMCGEIHTGTYSADWPEAAAWGKPGGEWRHVSSEGFEEDETCPTVRLLAFPHADRPGCQESWRPAQLP